MESHKAVFPPFPHSLEIRVLGIGCGFTAVDLLEPSVLLIGEVAPCAAASPALHVVAEFGGFFGLAAVEEGVQLVERAEVEVAGAVANGRTGVSLDEVTGVGLVVLVVHQDARHGMSLGAQKGESRS